MENFLSEDALNRQRVHHWKRIATHKPTKGSEEEYLLLQKKFEECKLKLGKVQQDLSASDETAQQARAESKKSRDEAHELRQQLQDIKGEVDDLAKDNREKQKEITDLRALDTDQKQKINQLASDIGKLENDKLELEKQVTSLKQDMMLRNDIDMDTHKPVEPTIDPDEVVMSEILDECNDNHMETDPSPTVEQKMQTLHETPPENTAGPSDALIVQTSQEDKNFDDDEDTPKRPTQKVKKKSLFE